MGDGLFDAFDIPEQHYVEQVEESWTFGDEGNLNKKPEEPWDPLGDF